MRFYFFDALSFLGLKWERIRKTGEEELPSESFFSDFREVQGLKYAFRIDQSSPGTEFKQTLTAEKIEINPPLTIPASASHRARRPPLTRLLLHPRLLHPLRFRSSGLYCSCQSV